MSAPNTPPRVDCQSCDGDGWYVSAEHDPGCDGNCDLCPIPVQRECETCGGSGAVVSVGGQGDVPGKGSETAA